MKPRSWFLLIGLVVFIPIVAWTVLNAIVWVAATIAFSSINDDVNQRIAMLTELPEGKLAPPGSTLVEERRFGSFAFEPDVQRMYVLTLTQDDVVQFYDSELTQRDWNLMDPPPGLAAHHYWTNGNYTVQLSFGHWKPDATGNSNIFIIRISESPGLHP